MTTVVNTVTGEIVAVSPQEHNAVARLQTAITALTEAVDFMPITEIVERKAEVATIQSATRELGMSKEAQELAAEAVRRAEWTLGRAMRRGQAEGTIRRNGDRTTRYDQTGLSRGEIDRGRRVTNSSVADVGPEDFVKHGQERHDIYTMVDGAPEPEQFEQALTEAREEGNLSRANVVRKVKSQASGHQTRDQRAELIEDLAAQGYSSRQMPSKVGVTEESVRQIARDYGIEIPADRSVGKTRRINSTSVVVNTATALEGLVSGVELIDFAALDVEEVSQWTASLTESMRTLNRFVKQIKETIQ